jgi:hypothetical protein
MATSKKSVDRDYRKKASDFPAAYMRLRTVLDGLQISALRYCLEDKNVQKRFKRMAEIEAILLPIIRGMQDKLLLPGGGGGGCGEGYFDCGGVCVPYQCPISK